MLKNSTQATASSTVPFTDAILPGLDTNVWDQLKNTQAPTYPRLATDATADVVVIGAGIVGLSIAYDLIRGGKKVILLEAATIGSGQTGKSTAQLMLWNDDYYHKIEEEFGVSTSGKVADAHCFAIDTIKKISEAEDIDCGFAYVDGYLFPADERPTTYDKLEKELQACKRAGLSSVQRVDLGGDVEFGGIRSALKFPRCANFDPIKYSKGLAEAIAKRGGQIYESSRVKSSDGGKVQTVAGATIRAPIIVFASNSPLHRNLTLHSRQAAEKCYAVALKMPEDGMEDGQFWDTEKPYHSVRLVKGTSKGDVLLVRGGGHPAGIKPEEINRDTYGVLERWARRRWPQAGEVAWQWAGQLYEPIDKLWLYGQDPLNGFQLDGTYYIATGDSGQGTVGAPLAAKIISDQILGYDGPWSEVYAPARLPAASKDTAASLVQVLSDVTAGYVDNVSPAGAQSLRVADLARNSGAVVQEGIKKVAAFVDEEGVQHKHTAVCPHLGCVVQWNPVDRSFNCPCHGAGFDRYGKVIQGPAKSDLAPL
ncbi:hypothetical protein WJX84_004620 [Apatococcus fuscideae]|uniref:Rieske domain-containing protein n=1 Tax=Apatococcus fuscideae TaxID=2026836 RepID=A0AAW1TGH4_9CHLO